MSNHSANQKPIYRYSWWTHHWYRRWPRGWEYGYGFQFEVEPI